MFERQQPQGISLAALRRALSEPRLEAYRLHADESTSALFGRYRWNMALCAAMHPALHLLEVALRNNVHLAIAGLYRTPAWYDLGLTVLNAREAESIQKAKDELRRDGTPEEPDRLVAELNFGFWTSLFAVEYEQKFWPRLLAVTFPHIPKRHRTRSFIAGRLHSIRRVRNRVSHHEQVCLPGLPQRYSEILETMGWLVPNLSGILPTGEDFDEVYARGPAAYEIKFDR
jgi:hypothetical protein